MTIIPRDSTLWIKRMQRMTVNIKGIIIEIEDGLFNQYLSITRPDIVLQSPEGKEFVQTTFENFVTGYYYVYSLDEIDVNEEHQTVTSRPIYVPDKAKTDEPVSLLTESITRMIAEYVKNFASVCRSEFIYS